MAEGDNAIPDPEKWERIKNFRKLRELFRGRITDEEAKILLRLHEWNLGRTVLVILNASSRDLRELLGNNTIDGRISIVTKDDVLRDLARRKEISHEIRQYVCTDCEKMWWRRVAVRKSVSRCSRCKTKYDPLPRNREWGFGEYECECGQAFKGIGVLGQTECMCYKCGQKCPIVRILPPIRRDNHAGRHRTWQAHSCNGHNCYNRRGRADPNVVCIHLRSNPIRYLPGSQHHASTGSTVNTFLNQDDIDPPYEPSLPDTIE